MADTTDLYAILNWFDEVPECHMYIKNAVDAAEFVSNWCEDNEMSYEGIDDIHYFPSESARRSLVVSPVKDGLKRGNYAIASKIAEVDWQDGTTKVTINEED